MPLLLPARTKKKIMKALEKSVAKKSLRGRLPSNSGRQWFFHWTYKASPVAITHRMQHATAIQNQIRMNGLMFFNKA